MGKDKVTSPMEGALIEVYRRLSPEHKGKLLGVAEELMLAEATPSGASKKRASKKAAAAQQQSGERHLK